MAQRASSLPQVFVERTGKGPELLLLHGGAGPATTWRGLGVLHRRWTLLAVHRRGYPPSPPPPDGRQDFEIDAADIEPFLESRPHVMAHSYGALGAMIATARHPDLVRSLTLLEPAFFLAAADPDIAYLKHLGDTFLDKGLAMEPSKLREFLRVAGAEVDDGPLSKDVEWGVRRATGGRLPEEAVLDFESLREAGMPCLVVSGGHTEVGERMCDETAKRLQAQRLVVSGAGHFIANAPGFADHLDHFLAGTEGAHK
jgi:pimeloyl-ACP methyl ester carboxylesterase